MPYKPTSHVICQKLSLILNNTKINMLFKQTS